MSKMDYEIIKLAFAIITGIATTGTFIYFLLDRKPRCKINTRISTTDIGRVPTPDIIIFITNTGKVDLFIHAVWIISSQMEDSFYVRFSQRNMNTGSIDLHPKRRISTRVYVHDIRPLFKKELNKKTAPTIQVKVVLESGEWFHSKKLSIPLELLEAKSIQS